MDHQLMILLKKVMFDYFLEKNYPSKFSYFSQEAPNRPSTLEEATAVLKDALSPMRTAQLYSTESIERKELDSILLHDNKELSQAINSIQEAYDDAKKITPEQYSAVENADVLISAIKPFNPPKDIDLSQVRQISSVKFFYKGAIQWIESMNNLPTDSKKIIHNIIKDKYKETVERLILKITVIHEKLSTSIYQYKKTTPAEDRTIKLLNKEVEIDKFNQLFESILHANTRSMPPAAAAAVSSASMFKQKALDPSATINSDQAADNTNTPKK